MTLAPKSVNLRALAVGINQGSDGGFVATDGTVPLVADWNVGGFHISNLLDPVNPQDAATKAYVDASAGTDPNAIRKDGTHVWTADQSVGGFSFTNLANIHFLGSVDHTVGVDAPSAGAGNPGHLLTLTTPAGNNGTSGAGGAAGVLAITTGAGGNSVSSTGGVGGDFNITFGTGGSGIAGPNRAGDLTITGGSQFSATFSSTILLASSGSSIELSANSHVVILNSSGGLSVGTTLDGGAGTVVVPAGYGFDDSTVAKNAITLNTGTIYVADTTLPTQIQGAPITIHANTGNITLMPGSTGAVVYNKGTVVPDNNVTGTTVTLTTGMTFARLSAAGTTITLDVAAVDGSRWELQEDTGTTTATPHTFVTSDSSTVIFRANGADGASGVNSLSLGSVNRALIVVTHYHGSFYIQA